MNKPLYRCDGKVPDCAKETCGYVTKDFANGCFLTSNKEHGLYEIDISNDTEVDFVVIALPRDQVSNFEKRIRRELDFMITYYSKLIMYQNIPEAAWKVTELSKQIDAFESIVKQLVYAWYFLHTA